MPRIRYIKPEAFDDEDLCALPFSHRWAFAGLWTQADREGRLEDRPKRLKARVLPFDALDMEIVLTDLARAGLIIRYIAQGRAYIAMKEHGWKKHQRPRNDEPDSEIPPPGAHSVVYASLGDEEAVGAGLRTQHSTAQGDAVTVTNPSLHSDEPVTAERIGMGIGMGNGDRNESSSEALARSEPTADTGKAGRSEKPTLQEALEPRVRGQARGHDDSPVVMSFPTIGTQGREWHLRTHQLESWCGLYPGLDVLVEAQKALAWLHANPNRQKTVKGMPAFLVNWFNRTVNSSRGGGPSPGGGKSKLTTALERASGDW